MDAFDDSALKTEAWRKERSDLKTTMLQRTSALASGLDRVDLFGLAMYQEFLSGAGIIDVGSLQRAALDFNAQAAAIAAIHAKVQEIDALKNPDLSIMATNIATYIEQKGLESALADYKKRFEQNEV